MKENDNFIKLTLLNRWKRIFLILHWKLKWNLLGVLVKGKQLILHWKANMTLIFGLFFFKYDAYFERGGYMIFIKLFLHGN